jgi:hypothetical protein
MDSDAVDTADALDVSVSVCVVETWLDVIIALEGEVQWGKGGVREK